MNVSYLKNKRCNLRRSRVEQLEPKVVLTGLNPTTDSFYRWTTPSRPASDDLRIEETTSEMVRYHDRVDIKMVTRNLDPGNIYTAWWVGFNNPEACLVQECGVPSLRYDDAQAFIYYAGEVNLVPESGGFSAVGTFEGSLYKQQPCQDQDASVCEPRAEEPWDDLPAAEVGMENPYTVAMHLVLRDHGRALEHPELLEFQKTTFDGGCLHEEFELFEDWLIDRGVSLTPNTCRNVQFTVHDPVLDVDFDGDGNVNGADIDALFAQLNTNLGRFDLDNDDIVSQQDVTLLVKDLLLADFGDSDLDHDVDFADFLTLSQNFGGEDKGWEDGDFDGDREITFADFLILSANFGQ